MIWGSNIKRLKHFVNNNNKCDGLLFRCKKLGLIHDNDNVFFIEGPM